MILYPPDRISQRSLERAPARYTFSIMPLLHLLQQEALKRDLTSFNTELTLELVFYLVRDMDYQRASSRRSATIISEWRGTCSGKHYLLQKLFSELGYQTKLMICTHQFTLKNSAHFPKMLKEHLLESPVPDVHNFIRLKADKNSWMDIDATWPTSTQKLGMPVNEQFKLNQNMQIACEPIEIWEVPFESDAQAFKEALIQKHCKTQLERRDQFIEALSAWLSSAVK